MTKITPVNFTLNNQGTNISSKVLKEDWCDNIFFILEIVLKA